MNRKGFGVEDTPFMLLATVAVLMLVVWIGIGVMGSFVKGNEYQAAVEASTEIYKRAKLLSLGYDGSSDRVRVSVPEGYAVLVDDHIVTLSNTEYVNDLLVNSTELTEPLEIQGVNMVSNSTLIGPGDHEVYLIYENGDVVISWE